MTTTHTPRTAYRCFSSATLQVCAYVRPRRVPTCMPFFSAPDVGHVPPVFVSTGRSFRHASVEWEGRGRRRGASASSDPGRRLRLDGDALKPGCDLCAPGSSPSSTRRARPATKWVRVDRHRASKSRMAGSHRNLSSPVRPDFEILVTVRHTFPVPSRLSRVRAGWRVDPSLWDRCQHISVPECPSMSLRSFAQRSNAPRAGANSRAQRAKSE